MPQTTFDKFANNVFTNLRKPYNPGDGKLFVYNATKFTYPSRVQCIGGVGGFRTQVNYSILQLTGADTSTSGNHFLIVGNAVENTTDVAIPQGSTIALWETAGQLTAFGSAINNLEANGTGQPGAQGPQGYQGPTGLTGLTGSQGVSGANGSQGPQGSQGATGADSTVAGPQGGAGANGSQGVAGPSGPQGYQGFQGSTGAASTVAGPQGAAGQAGSQGGAGANGSQGPQGGAGSPGAQGSAGAVGSQGQAGANGSQGYQGAKGDTGLQGSQGYQGFQGTTGSQGTAGSIGSQGAKGDTGLQGSQGYQGFQGTTGSQGTAGSIGSQGAKGDTGAQGYQGSQGYQGAFVTGPQGSAGANGSQGPQGYQGAASTVAGPQGPQGTQGSQGYQGSQGVIGVVPINQGGTGQQSADTAAVALLGTPPTDQKAYAYTSWVPAGGPSWQAFSSFCLSTSGGGSINNGIVDQVAMQIVGAHSGIANAQTKTMLSITNGDYSKFFTVDAGCNVQATSFKGVGTQLTSLNASNITSGAVPTAQLGSGTANATTYLRGDNTWAAVTGGSATPGGSTGQLQYNNAGAFGGTTALTTTTTNPLAITFNNAQYQTTSAQYAAINVENPSAIGQSFIQFTNSGTPVGKLRSDYAGGMSYVSYQGGGHTYYCGGDNGTGTVVCRISSGGIGLNKTSIADGTMITTGTSLKIGQTGDTYGPTYLTLKNGGGANGAIFSSTGSVNLIDFGFVTPFNVQSNLRYECRSNSLISSNNSSYGEFQYNMNATGGAGGYTYPFVIGASTCTFFAQSQDTNASHKAGRVGINSATPAAKLHVVPESSTVGQITQASSGQTSDLHEWQDSSGNVLSGVDSNGYLRSVVGSGAPTSTPPSGSIYLDSTAGNLWVMVGSTWKKATLS